MYCSLVVISNFDKKWFFLFKIVNHFDKNDQSVIN
jgi:hypothetical protein